MKKSFGNAGYKGLSYGLGLLFFAWLAYVGCASGPKVTPEQQAGKQARELAKQDSIRKYEAAKNWSLGHENYKNKEYDRVAKYFWKVINLDKEGRFKDVYTFLAQTYFQLGKIDSAELVYGMGLKQYPDNLHLNRNLGYIYANKGEIEKAIPLYEKTVEQDPENLNDWKQLGALYAQADDTENAIRAYEKIVELDPNDAEARTVLTALLRQTGNEGAALQQMEESLAKDPTNKQLLFDLGLTYMGMQQYSKASKKFSKLVEIDPNDIVARENLAKVYYRNKQYEKAIQQYKKIFELDPDNVKALTEWATCYLDLGNLRQARTLARRATRVDPRYGMAFYTLGKVYEKAVESCKAKSGRTGYSFDDKLVFKIAHEEYKRAVNDIETKQRALASMRSLEPVLPSQEDFFMHKNQRIAKDPCYEWIYK